MPLDGKRIVVTGGTGGVGQPLVQGLLSRGAQVTLLGRTPPPEAPRGSGQSRDLHAAGDLLELGVDHLLRLGERGVGRGDEEVLHHREVLGLEELGVDRDRHELLGAVDHDLHTERRHAL